jgi:predicted MPP superfamily phosphohydrolase
MDLVFAGHAHGGQVVLPFLGGLVAPDQGIFPKYHAGLYRMGNTAMVVSRGLGNSIFPLRIFNPPEMVLAVLERAQGH